MEGKGLLMLARMELRKEVHDHFIITGIKGKWRMIYLSKSHHTDNNQPKQDILKPKT